MNKRKEILAVLLSAALLLAALLAAGWLLLPKEYMSGIDWDRYRLEPENSIDVFFAGSSIVYCDVSPAWIYERSGVTSYLICGPEQTLPMAYYAIRQACAAQTPKAIFLEMNSMFIGPEEIHAPDNVAFMPLGRNHLEAAFTAVEREDIAEVLLPVLDYHDYWYSLSGEGLRSRLHPQVDLYAGFTPYDHIEPMEGAQEREIGMDYYGTALDYLKKTVEYCRRQGMRVYLFLSPSLSRVPASAVEKLRADLADVPYDGFLDFNSEEYQARLNLDASRDWRDELHLNIGGARKVSLLLGDCLLELGLEPTENVDAALWQQRAAILEQ